MNSKRHDPPHPPTPSPRGEGEVGGSVAWPPLVTRSEDATLVIRQATQDDVFVLELWDREPGVIERTTDDPEADQAFEGAIWSEEVAANSDVTCYYITELDG